MAADVLLTHQDRLVIRMELTMIGIDRYSHEREFWDKHADRIWANVSNYKTSRFATFKGLGDFITYLSPVSEFFGDLQDKNILELACGDGWISLSLATSGAVVTGCDISPKSIAVARRFANANGLEKKVRFETMICENLAYEDNYFDLAIMHAALHHCDIEKTASQIHRILKPGGRAVLIEDYAYHPLMKIYRMLTPNKHTENEEALTNEDLRFIVSKFSEHHFEYFGIFDILEAAEHRFTRNVKPVLRSLDNYLYKQFPAIRKYSKLVEIFLVK